MKPEPSPQAQAHGNRPPLSLDRPIGFRPIDSSCFCAWLSSSHKCGGRGGCPAPGRARSSMTASTGTALPGGHEVRLWQALTRAKEMALRGCLENRSAVGRWWQAARMLPGCRQRGPNLERPHCISRHMHAYRSHMNAGRMHTGSRPTR